MLYLGYNFENQEIPNDRYFRSIESRGNAFDSKLFQCRVAGDYS